MAEINTTLEGYRLRSLLLVMGAAAIFFGGYRLGWQHGRDSRFDGGVNTERMAALRGAEAGQSDAADAQSTHKRRQQGAYTKCRGSNGELKQLIPDDLVDQSGATAACEQQQKQRPSKSSKSTSYSLSAHASSSQ